MRVPQPLLAGILGMKLPSFPKGQLEKDDVVGKHDALLGKKNNIFRFQNTVEYDFPFPQVGYVSSLEGKHCQ